MKKLSIVILASLLFGMVTYGSGWTDDGTVVRLTTTSDKVGIGITNPGKKLEVDGDIRIPGNERMYFGGASILGYASGGYHGLKLFGSGGGQDQLGIVVDPSGKIGIGTSSPIAKLGIADLGASNGVSILAISENTTTLDEFVFKGDFAGTGETGNLLKLETHWSNNVMTWRGDGNVGIGTTSPDEKLEVAGTVQMSGFKLTTGAANGYVLTSDGNGVGTWQPGGGGSLWSESGSNIYYNTGNVGIGTTSPGEKLDVAGTVEMNGFSLPTGAAYGYVLTSNNGGVGTWQSIPLQWSENGNDIYYETGNVCIGTDTPESELTVDGTITTREMKVKLTGWSDFVFEDNYKLMPINKLEKHIKEERSLPGIPKNEEVVKDGVKVGEMQAKLLEKVEELTLYVIELNKDVESLREENEELREKISTLVK